MTLVLNPAASSSSSKIRARGGVLLASVAREDEGDTTTTTTDGKGKRKGGGGGAARPVLKAFREALLRRIHAMFYGAMVWDPWLIIAQIGCLQCLFYLSLGAHLWLFVGTHVPSFTLKYFFDFTIISATSFVGWCTIIASLANACTGAFFLLVLVERTKKCLDFTATIYIVHLFFCLVFKGLPVNMIWWAVNGTSLIVMTVVGEWLCMRREQREIPLGAASRLQNP